MMDPEDLENLVREQGDAIDELKAEQMKLREALTIFVDSVDELQIGSETLSVVVGMAVGEIGWTRLQLVEVMRKADATIRRQHAQAEDPDAPKIMVPG